jgi:toxin YoeB
LLKDISHNPYEGIGKSEPLKFNYAGFWSRRIDEEHRLVYRVIDDEIQIAGVGREKVQRAIFAHAHA